MLIFATRVGLYGKLNVVSFCPSNNVIVQAIKYAAPEIIDTCITNKLRSSRFFFFDNKIKSNIFTNGKYT